MQIDETRRLAEAPRIRELIVRVVNPLLESVKEIADSHAKREYSWASPDLDWAKQLLGGQEVLAFLRGKDDAFLPYPDVAVAEKATQFHSLDQAIYRDFKRMHPLLASSIEEHDKMANHFRQSLLDLSRDVSSLGLKQGVEAILGQCDEKRLRDALLSMTCIATCELLGTPRSFTFDQVGVIRHRELWKEHGDSLMEELGKNPTIASGKSGIVREADSLAAQLHDIQEALFRLKEGYLREYHLTDEETQGQSHGRPPIL
jgi:hypothetical protein